MKLLLDTQAFDMQKFGGISRYYTEVYRLLKEQKIPITLPLLYSENLHLHQYRLLPTYFLNGAKFKGADRLRKFLIEKNSQYMLYLLNRGNFDLFIPTYYHPNFVSTLQKKPFVLTVYDMIHELFPQYFGGDPLIQTKKYLMYGAKRIIAISENTKSDIIKVYPDMDKSKIDVVYLSHSIKANGLLNHKLINEKKYILFVGNRGGYKNFDWLISSVSGWLKKNKIHLICLGANPLTSAESKLIKDLGIQDWVIQYAFREDELGAFYSNALAFVFPSQYEGFGIPVLEAMACSCPVLLPAISSFPEVAGNAGVYFDLEDSDSLVKGLDRVITDLSFRKAVIEKGRLQTEKFSWEATVAGCIKTYRNAIL